MRTAPVRVGVIGVGIMGERLLYAFVNHPETEIVAIADTSAERLKHIAGEYNIARTYTDYKEMLNADGFDLVYVAVPPKFHHQIALDVIAAGKHILCEKPLANSLEEAKDMVEAVRGKNLVHAINFPLNYTSGVQKFAELVKSGYLGDLRRIEMVMHFPQWPRAWQQTPWIGGREQGGFIREVSPHLVQLIQKTFGPIARVEGEIEYPADEAACETGVIAKMQLSDGTPILVSGLSGIADQERVAVKAYGSKGTIALENWSNLLGSEAGQTLAPIELPEYDRRHGLVSELVQAIDGKSAELYDFHVGYEVQIILETLLQASTDQGWIDVTVFSEVNV